MIKFGRKYELTIQGNSKDSSGQFTTHVFKNPLTCKFEIDRQDFSMTNTARFTIYGLSKFSRSDIFYESIFRDGLVPMTFKAGYESQPNLSLAFSGNVKLAYTEREGPELATYIEALDGGFGVETSTIKEEIPSNWKFTPTMKFLMKGLKGITSSTVLLDKEPDPGTATLVANGNIWNILQENTPQDGSLFIDNNAVNMLGKNVTLPSQTLTELSSNTGLLGIPKKYGFHVTCDSLFEPGLQIGQKITLKSDVLPAVNDDYKVIGLHHSGTISGVESGSARTSISLLSLKAGS